MWSLILIEISPAPRIGTVVVCRWYAVWSREEAKVRLSSSTLACLVFAFVLIFVINCEWFFWADFIVCMLDVPGWRYRSWISISFWYRERCRYKVNTTKEDCSLYHHRPISLDFYVLRSALESNQLDMSTSDNWYILFTSCAYILIRYGCQRSIHIVEAANWQVINHPMSGVHTIEEEDKNGREAERSPKKWGREKEIWSTGIFRSALSLLVPESTWACPDKGRYGRYWVPCSRYDT